MNNTYRTKTLNQMGWMFSHSDPVLTAFLTHVHNSHGYFVDIGAAYGYATLEALRHGGRVLAIDIDQRHLDVLLKECPPPYRSALETVCGHFPNTIDLPENTFDGILLSRVLIFLQGKEIDLALTKIQKTLKPGGIVYISSPSPLRKKWALLKPIYEEQKAAGFPWPGYIENLWKILPDLESILPNSIQLIEAQSLRKGLLKAGLIVETCDYTPKEDTPYEEAFNLCYAMASKPNNSKSIK